MHWACIRVRGVNFIKNVDYFDLIEMSNFWPFPPRPLKKNFIPQKIRAEFFVYRRIIVLLLRKDLTFEMVN